MTPTDRRNCAILESARDYARRISRKRGYQAMLDYLNSLIDLSAGCVAGDGRYYPRAGFDSSAGLLKRLRDEGVTIPEQSARPGHQLRRITMTTKRGIAIATPENETVYTVTYAGSADCDKDVGYEYLKGLAKAGWEVHVGGVAFSRAHIIQAQEASR